jgi:hypothetical protein
MPNHPRWFLSPLGLAFLVILSSASSYASDSGSPPWPAECKQAPCVHFIFAGACNFQVKRDAAGNATSVNVLIPDSIRQPLGGHDVKDHRALIQFNRMHLAQPDTPLPPCAPKSDCVLYDIGDRDVSFNLPSMQIGGRDFTDLPSFAKYVLPIDQNMLLSKSPPFTTAVLHAGGLWATPSKYKCHFPKPKQAQVYHREAIVSVPLDGSKDRFAIEVEDDSLEFKYGKGSQIVIRFLSVPSPEACLTKPMPIWSVDHDFAINYLLAERPPATEPWPVPSAGGLSGDDYDEIEFCKAATTAENSFQELMALQKLKGLREKPSMIEQRLVRTMSSMGSDCIGARWD